jgi:biopolymer transport protein ExbB/TolQ
MNILSGMETILYALSFVLFYPVLAGLILISGWIVICLGSFMREYWERRRKSSPLVERYKSLLDKEIQSVREPVQIQNIDIKLENLLQHTESGLIKSLDRVRFVIRVGPALGLMGTLIPMSIALTQLAQGELPKMAGSMVTAFTTTVVGLGCGVAAYLIGSAKEKWVRADMREMESLTELAFRNLNHNAQDIKNEVRKEEENEILEKTL